MDSGWRIEVLADRHDRAGFSCGRSPLDVFMRTQAGQYARRNLGSTYVAVQPPDIRIAGYYTLAASSLQAVELPAKLARKLPQHPIPSLLLARLAVDQSFQNRGLGSNLLTDAMRRTLDIADSIGIHALHVHALDDEAKAWYERHDFVPLPDHSRHLVLSVADIRKAWG